MAEKTADLHIHSYYSDGTMSPEEILKEAIKNNVGMIAITDHDMLDGSLELKNLCLDRDIIYIPGVELDSLEDGLNYHVLGYGVDLYNSEFCSFVNKNCQMLYEVNVKLIEKMQMDVASVSIEDYNAFPHDKRQGGWKALQYLLAKGITTKLRDGFELYKKYDVSYDSVNFPSIKGVCEQIHRAGGKAILAHPGVSIKESDLSLFKLKLLTFLEYGLDGMECYYVTHSEDITQLCLGICRERNLLVTAGSDCHGTFGSASIGDVNIPMSKLNIKQCLSSVELLI